MYLDRRARSEIARVAWRHRSPRRLWTLYSYAAGVATIRAILRVLHAIDDVLWPEIRRCRVERPVFLFANARSGTTFLHRLLSLDEERFAHFRLYQSIFCSVTAQRMVDALERADRRVPGRPLRRFVDWINRTFFRGWEGIHEMGIDVAEEDEALFVFCASSPSITLLVPWADELPSVRWFDEHPEPERRAFLDFYEDAIRRRLFAAGGDKTFLNKNALFAPRIRSVHERFPDARFIYLVRHPYESLASFVNMFYVKWVTHSPEIARNSPESRALARLAMDYLLYALDVRRSLAPDQLLVLRYDELVAAPRETVARIYTWLGVPMGGTFASRLDDELQRQREQGNGQRYSLEDFGLSREEVHAALAPVFEEFGFEP